MRLAVGVLEVIYEVDDVESSAALAAHSGIDKFRCQLEFVETVGARCLRHPSPRSFPCSDASFPPRDPQGWFPASSLL